MGPPAWPVFGGLAAATLKRDRIALATGTGVRIYRVTN
jgi:hypothetical protein